MYLKTSVTIVSCNVQCTRCRTRCRTTEGIRFPFYNNVLKIRVLHNQTITGLLRFVWNTCNKNVILACKINLCKIPKMLFHRWCWKIIYKKKQQNKNALKCSKTSMGSKTACKQVRTSNSNKMIPTKKTTTSKKVSVCVHASFKLAYTNPQL